MTSEENLSKITAIVILEIAGKPKEHVEATIKNYTEKIVKEFTVKSNKIAEVEEKDGVFSTFAEMDIDFDSLGKLIGFCFDYMPASVDIIEPENLNLTSPEATGLINDMISNLHHINMAFREVAVENDFLKRNMKNLVKNLITINLSKNKLKIEDLSKFTGIVSEELNHFLEDLISQGYVTKEDDYFVLTKK